MLMKNVEHFLQVNQIKYVLHKHRAVFNSADGEKYCGNIPGLACKNLFLKNKKANRYFLLVLPAKKRTDLKKFTEIVNEKNITFANADELSEKLGLTPGSASPFGLLNDQNKEVEVYINQEVYNAVIVSFHPNRNTVSVELSYEMFHKFLRAIDNKIQIIEL